MHESITNCWNYTAPGQDGEVRVNHKGPVLLLKDETSLEAFRSKLTYTATFLGIASFTFNAHTHPGRPEDS